MPQAFSTVGLLTVYPVARSGNAVSPVAHEIRKNADAVVASAESSRALFGNKADIISEVWRVAVENAEENWDGNGAAPVDSLAACAAVDFLRALPPRVTLPEVTSEPDGAISLDWIESRHRIFSISFTHNRRLPFAWLDGSERGHGVVNFDREEIPLRALAEICRISTNVVPPLRLT